MPGVEEKSVNVEVKDSMLFVNGDISLGVEHEALSILYQERENVKRYSRFLSLPLEADSDQAAASVRNGLLTIRFPRKKVGRRLPVNQQQQFQQQNMVQNSYGQFQNLQENPRQEAYNQNQNVQHQVRNQQ